MDFDHREANAKRAQVSDLVNKSWNVIADEIAKCDVVCANCHRIRSHNRKQHLGSTAKSEPSAQLDLPGDTPATAPPITGALRRS